MKQPDFCALAYFGQVPRAPERPRFYSWELPARRSWLARLADLFRRSA